MSPKQWFNEELPWFLFRQISLTAGLIEESDFHTLLLHSIWHVITCHLASGKCNCILVRESDQNVILVFQDSSEWVHILKGSQGLRITELEHFSLFRSQLPELHLLLNHTAHPVVNYSPRTFILAVLTHSYANSARKLLLMTVSPVKFMMAPRWEATSGKAQASGKKLPQKHCFSFSILLP